MRFAKILKAVKDPPRAARYFIRQYQNKRAERWYETACVVADEYCRRINPELWEESLEYIEKLRKEVQQEYAGLEVHGLSEESNVGGSANLELLYFYVRLVKPETVVETGVAAGWSSRAILRALERNGKGTLYSNDLPYSMRPNKKDETTISENDIGVIVPTELKHRWELSLGPDRENLPKIIDTVESVDLFHYDSDKSISGREFAVNQTKQKFHNKSVLIMDDIEDNYYFKRLVTSNNYEWDIVASARSKLVGVVEIDDC